MADKPKTLTSAAGIPVGDNQNALTAGERGPLLIQDWQLFEKHAHFNRERNRAHVTPKDGGIRHAHGCHRSLHFYKADPAYGEGVAKGLDLPLPKMS